MPTIQAIPLDQIQPSPFQARKDFDPEALQGLADSMKLEGLLNPIVVRKVSDHFELISGERRWRAAKLLGWEMIEAKVIETESDAKAAAKGMIENLQREDLNPIEEAEGFQTLEQLDPKAWTQERIGQIAGKDKTYINRSLALLGLPEEIQKKLRYRNLSRSHGVELARLPNQKLQLKAFQQIPGKLTVEETRALVDQMLGKKEKTPAETKPMPGVPDPLAKGWDALMENTQITPGSWQVHYKGTGQWSIQLHTPGITPIADMTRWLKAALAAMETLGGDVSDNPAIELKSSGIPDQPIVHIKEKYAPKDEAELSKAEADTKRIRLPQTPAEHAELVSLIPNGPTAVYSWIYGPNSFYLKNIQGKTWKDLGMNNPDYDVPVMMEELRMMMPAETPRSTFDSVTLDAMIARRKAQRMLP